MNEHRAEIAAQLNREAQCPCVHAYSSDCTRKPVTDGANRCACKCHEFYDNPDESAAPGLRAALASVPPATEGT